LPDQGSPALLSFYDFPAEPWKHLRTSNTIESTFATVRHRCDVELADVAEPTEV
jgi:transposase-like protein